MNNDKEHQFELLVREHKRTKERRRIETVPLTVDIDPFEADDPKTQQVRKLHDLISQLELIDRSLVLLWLEGI